MSAKLNPSRYAHCEGHTGVCFSQDARYIITCGGEGDIRIWTGIEDDEAIDKCVGEQAFAVCQRGEKLYVGTNQNSVQALTFPEPELDGVVARFTAPVTHIDASADGSLIVSASCDMKIGITDVDTSTTDMVSGHRAPVLSVSLDPKLEFLASSSCDGTVRVWKLSDRQQAVSWDCVPKSNSRQHATAIGHSAWTPTTGARLAVPDAARVHLYARATWEKTATFSDPEPGKQLFSVVKFSSCGQHLAASSTEGHILVWAASSQQLLSRLQTDERQHVCSLDWSPQMPQIAFCDTNGNFGTVDLPSAPAQANNLKAEDVPMADPTFGDTDDEDNVNAISLEKIKNESGFLTDGLLDDDKTNDKDGDDGRSSRMSDVRPTASMPKVELQPPFQPSSTPVSLQYRFMVWNDVGIVKQTNTEDENAIDVEFHDTGLHHSFRVNNVAAHTMAALSDEALVMACEAQDDNPSKLVCVTLNAWDGSREWSVAIEGEEEALCVAAGRGFVAVATDTRALRVFTTCGTQRELVSLPGPVVCMAAREYTLAVVYHSSVGLDGDQRLSYVHLWLGGASVLARTCPARGELPLSPRARLRWLGHSDEGSLFALDAAGILRKLSPSGLWAPVCDVDSQCKGKSDHHFVVGVCEKFQTIRSVLCKGAFFPPTTPRPAVAEISWQVPLCEVNGGAEKGVLEEQFWRAHIAQPALPDDDDAARDNADRTIKKTLLKLFALACQSGLEMRAVGLCRLMSPEVAQMAVKYASKLGRTQLADRITEAAGRRPPPSPPPFLRSDEGTASECWAQPVGERESYNQLSQDMFASSAEDHTPSADNPILALKQRQLLAQSSVLSNGSSRGSNPFKKTGDHKDETVKGLEGLIKKAVAKPPPRPSAHEPPSKKTSSNENKPKKQTFTGWFSSQKKNLEEEFPEMDSSELTKAALKRYKEEQNANPINNQSVKKFFGTTTSNLETNQKVEENIPTSDALSEVKKRKAYDDEMSDKPEPKKKSFSEKLNKFAFVKP